MFFFFHFCLSEIPVTKKYTGNLVIVLKLQSHKGYRPLTASGIFCFSHGYLRVWWDLHGYPRIFFRHPAFTPSILVQSYNFFWDRTVFLFVWWPWHDIEVNQRHLMAISSWLHHIMWYFLSLGVLWWPLDHLMNTIRVPWGDWKIFQYRSLCLISRSSQDIVGQGCDISFWAAVTSSVRSHPRPDRHI